MDVEVRLEKRISLRPLEETICPLAKVPDVDRPV